MYAGDMTVVACLSGQVKRNFYELFIVHFNYGE